MMKWIRKCHVPVVVALASWLLSQVLIFDMGVGVEYQLLFCLGYIFVFTTGTRTFGFVFIYRIMVPLLSGLCAVWFYGWAHSVPELASFFSASVQNLNYLDWLYEIQAPLYAVCIAFLLWKGLSDLDALRRSVYAEALQVERMTGFLGYFNKDTPALRPVIGAILDQLLEYVDNLVDKKNQQLYSSDDNSSTIRRCTELIAALHPLDDKNDEVALTEMMKALSDLAQARSIRMCQMDIRLSPYLLIVLFATSATMIMPFYFSPPSDTEYVRETTLFILASFLTFFPITLMDLSKPFVGYWNVGVGPFLHVRTLIVSERERFVE